MLRPSLCSYMCKLLSHKKQSRRCRWRSDCYRQQHGTTTDPTDAWKQPSTPSRERAKPDPTVIDEIRAWPAAPSAHLRHGLPSLHLSPHAANAPTGMSRCEMARFPGTNDEGVFTHGTLVGPPLALQLSYYVGAPPPRPRGSFVFSVSRV